MPYDLTYKTSRSSKSIETNSRLEVLGVGGGGEEELLDENRISDWVM